jgi:hypothetical protein
MPCSDHDCPTNRARARRVSVRRADKAPVGVSMWLDGIAGIGHRHALLSTYSPSSCFPQSHRGHAPPRYSLIKNHGFTIIFYWISDPMFCRRPRNESSPSVSMYNPSGAACGSQQSILSLISNVSPRMRKVTDLQKTANTASSSRAGRHMLRMATANETIGPSYAYSIRRCCVA